MISSLWQKCSTTLSCSIMNGHIWSCKYLHLWAHPGKRYKKRDLSKHQKQPRDQVNHTPSVAVPLLFLFPASLVLYLRERRWQSLASDFLLFLPKLLQEGSQGSYIRCARLIWLHLSFSPFIASGEQEVFLACSLFNPKEGAQNRPAEALCLEVPVSLWELWPHYRWVRTRSLKGTGKCIRGQKTVLVSLARASKGNHKDTQS